MTPIGHAQMQTAGIVFGIHRDRGQSQIGCGAGDADGDLAAVGDQQFGHTHAFCVRGLRP
jgi:hypothetical protein